jgi:hypothetical protein
MRQCSAVKDYHGALRQRTATNRDVMTGARGDTHLLEGSYKGFELSGRLLHEQQPRQGRVEGGAVAAVGGVVQERKVLCCVVLQDVRCGVQLQQQLPAHVACRQVLPMIT